MVFKSWHMVSIQFFPRSSWFVLDAVVHLPIHGLLRYSIVLHAYSTWPSHLSLLSLMMRFISLQLVRCLISSLRTFSFQDIPNSHRWNLLLVASSFFLLHGRKGHNSAPYNRVDMTRDSYSLTLTFKLICLFYNTLVNRSMLDNVFGTSSVIYGSPCRIFIFLLLYNM